MAKSKAQKALAAGPSKIGAKARAAANKLTQKASGPKHAASSAPDSKKSSGSDFSVGKHAKGAAKGKHAAPENKRSVLKNALTRSDAPAKGKHTKGTSMSLTEAVAARRKSRAAGISK